MKDNKRITQLFAVLLLDSESVEEKGIRYFSSGDRICINQERANLMKDLPNPDFQQSPLINEKVASVLAIIRNSNLANALMAHIETLINI